MDLKVSCRCANTASFVVSKEEDCVDPLVGRLGIFHPVQQRAVRRIQRAGHANAEEKNECRATSSRQICLAQEFFKGEEIFNRSLFFHAPARRNHAAKLQRAVDTTGPHECDKGVVVVVTCGGVVGYSKHTFGLVAHLLRHASSPELREQLEGHGLANASAHRRPLRSNILELLGKQLRIGGCFLRALSCHVPLSHQGWIGSSI
mmetsp:Transcript_62549/g.146717  ORF Transcript_62549/g.146717 Transcript_62549/m.146717 type:complete len:204 (-) Transcript_62549:216-827(-)